MKNKNIFKARKMLLEIEDRIAKICIGFGEGRISKVEFEKFCEKAQKLQVKLLEKNYMLD